MVRPGRSLGCPFRSPSPEIWGAVLALAFLLTCCSGDPCSAGGLNRRPPPDNHCGTEEERGRWRASCTTGWTGFAGDQKHRRVAASGDRPGPEHWKQVSVSARRSSAHIYDLQPPVLDSLFDAPSAAWPQLVSLPGWCEVLEVSTICFRRGEIGLYRAAQELVGNAVRPTSADQLWPASGEGYGSAMMVRAIPRGAGQRGLGINSSEPRTARRRVSRRHGKTPGNTGNRSHPHPGKTTHAGGTTAAAAALGHLGWRRCARGVADWHPLAGCAGAVRRLCRSAGPGGSRESDHPPSAWPAENHPGQAGRSKRQQPTGSPRKTGGRQRAGLRRVQRGYAVAVFAIGLENVNTNILPRHTAGT